MSAEQAAGFYPRGFEPAPIPQPQPQPRVLEVGKPATELGSLIANFDQNWASEGLPRDWYNFGKAGFSMNSQMNLLPDLEAQSRQLWSERTEQDIRGFTVEYLKQELVHPSFYRKVVKDGKTVLVDVRYGKGLVDMVSPQERNGSVREALGEIQDYLVSEGDAVMTSPKGWTGLQTDRGIPIEYPDSWFFGFMDQGERVVGFGIKTDFSLEECRQAIVKLTGQDLPEGASIEDYVKAIGKIKPDQGIGSPQDLVRVLQEVRPTPFVHKNKTWDEVSTNVGRLEEIYALGGQAEQFISEFKEFSQEEGHSKIELQKALAVTLLRLSKLYLVEEKQTQKSKERYKVLGNVIYPERFQIDREMIRPTYGQVLNEVEKIPGCAGGGSKAESITSIIDRVGIAGSGLGIKLPEDKYGAREVKCPDCGQISVRPKDKLLEKCLHCSSDSISC